QLREPDLVLAAGVEGRGAQRLALLEVEARRFQFRAREIDLKERVRGIDVERFLVLDDGLIPILRPLGSLRFLKRVVARAREQHERQGDGGNGGFRKFHSFRSWVVSMSYLLITLTVAFRKGHWPRGTCVLTSAGKPT